jgi:glycosyltransferase involved in cell wall biosynthesis
VSVVRDRRSGRYEELCHFVEQSALAEFSHDYGHEEFEEITVIIAAYNEEGAIGEVLAQLPQTVLGRKVTTVVVVDGSEDKTATVAKGAFVKVLHLRVNLGHGRALRCGYRLALERGARFIVTLDADGQNDPNEMERLLVPLFEKRADVVIASRRLGVDRSANRFRSKGVVFFSALASLLLRTRLSDTSNGYRAFSAEALQNIVGTLIQEQYQTAEVIVNLHAHGQKIVQVPATWYPRSAGESKKGTNLRYGFRYARVLLGTFWRTQGVRSSRWRASS